MNTHTRDKTLLKEILDLIDLSIAQAPKAKSAFLADLNVRDATALRVQAIGECMRSLSDEFRETHPELPWRQAIAMRNIIAHEYGQLDYEILWEVVTGKDFSSFRKHVQEIVE